MTGKQNGKLPKSKFRSNRSSAESPQKEDGLNKSPDLSLLRKPIQTSVTGFTQARDVFDTGTEEIKQLLSTECDVIYECKVCRNLFRSLANFISHKRIYCRQKFNTSLHTHFINSKYLKDDMMVILQNEQDYQNFLKNKEYTSNIIQAGKESLQKPFTKDLTSVIERLTLKQGSNSENTRITKNSVLKLQPTTHTAQAVYQTIVDTELNEEAIKEQVNEIEMLESSHEATLGPDGRVVDDRDLIPVIHISDDEDNEGSTNNSIVCKICKLKFSTLKTLRFHIKYKHAENRLVYPCPDCTETFANAWGVYRHLYKVHRKSAAYIRKLRESIQNKAFKLQQKCNDDKVLSFPPEVMEDISEEHRLDLENQEWMENLERDCEVPRCGGCGRKFERRAALSSHRQTCQLRIAAQNKIMTNMQKRLAAKIASRDTVPLTIVKTEAEKGEVEVEVSPVKVARLEAKPIEIQIRRDYHKGHMGSPKRTGTPVSEPNGNMLDTAEGNRKGEKGDSIINVRPNIINNDCTETVKDCDDANVVGTNSTLCVSVSESRDSFASKYSESENSSSEMNEDDELNFEDIRRICQSGNREIIDDSPTMDLELKPVLGDDCSIISSSHPKSPSENDVQECETSFTCNKCKEELTSLDELNDHIKNNHETTVFQCKFCNYKSEKVAECITHVKVKHKMLGDDERIQKFVKSISVPLSDPDPQESDSSEEETPVMASVGSQTIVVEEAVDKEADKPRATVTSGVVGILPIVFKENVIIKEEIHSNSSTSANCSDVEGETIIVKRKRGRPKKSEKLVNLRQFVEKKTEVVLPLKGPQSNVKKARRTDIEDVHGGSKESASSPDKAESVYSKAMCHIKKTKINISDTQHSASSMSSTVKRPIRNRVKPLNKDFEYDLSNLLKLEAEAYKESHFPAVTVHKPPLKRKPLFQNETMTSELSTEVGESKEQVKAEIEKMYAGSLHTLSLKAANNMRAHMKQVPPVVQRELPPFIAQRRSRTTPASSPSLQLTPNKDVPAPLKTKTEKSAIHQQITPSMIYEKLSLDNTKAKNSLGVINKHADTDTENGAKNEILASMSKVLSKSFKSSMDKSNKILKNDDTENKPEHQGPGFIYVKKEKDLLCPSRLGGKSTSNLTDLDETSFQKDRTLPSQLSLQSDEALAQSNKADKDTDTVQVQDEAIEFVASDKLPFVNILRRRKSIIHMKSDKDTSDLQDVMVSLTSKCYRKKIPGNDAVSLVDVSETNKNKELESDADNMISSNPSHCLPTGQGTAHNDTGVTSLAHACIEKECIVFNNSKPPDSKRFDVKGIKEKLSQILHSEKDTTGKDC